ncbi:alanine dehydrogenase [Enterococcus sp. PF1-24]|nr:alanine dehydrogenase [Enterococcus sp. PFB1-1]MDH6401376.1 alanine dehydrogenase [Enterococcus sp. PF1-24]
MEQQAYPKNLTVVDLDNQTPTILYQKATFPAEWLPINFVSQNSFYAGYAGVLHACLSFGLLPDDNTKVAILGNGNVSQGAFHGISKFTAQVRMFYRKTLPEFYQQKEQFDLIINGIEVGAQGTPILTLADQSLLKPGAFLIDIAADAGYAIEGNRFTTVSEPIYQENSRYYYTVPNTPTIAYHNVSKYLSQQFSQYIYKKDITIFKERALRGNK